MKKQDVEQEITIEDANKEKKSVVSLNIGKCYAFSPEDFEIDVSTVKYSNQSYIQVLGQDIFVDFIELPGVKKSGKMVANATRIYMTHIQAKKLANALNSILDSSYSAGRIETYPPKK